VADDLEALIEEARRKARRRRLRNAAVALSIAAVGLAVLGARQLGGDGTATHASAPLPHPPRPAPLPPRPLPKNGQLAVVQGDGDVLPGDGLFAMTPDGTRKHLLAACPGPPDDCYFGSFSWSPDGRYVAFLAGHGGGTAGGTNLWLYVVRANGGGLLRLARCGNCSTAENVAWSPDSHRVALATVDGLDAVDVTSGTQALLGGTSTLGQLDSVAAWSPGGTRIAFAIGGDLYSVKADGSGLGRITAVAGDIADPQWSPDGTRIVFDTQDRIYVVDADGSHLKLLLYGSLGSGPGVPSWSPDGRRILYFNTPGSPDNFAGEVWSMKPDGSARRRIYFAGCCVGLWHPPIWSPDGRRVALSGATETDGVVVMDANGAHRRTVLETSSVVAWQPLPRLWPAATSGGR
jgi:dipeptidyl aminopeptidase/acylaminoacyl peptidase